MKLKTLKEMETFHFGIDGHICPVCNLNQGGHELNYCDCDGVEINKLRQEAIKWLKLSDYDLYELGFDKSDNTDDLRKWIKHFFNITEEELEWLKWQTNQ